MSMIEHHLGYGILSELIAKYYHGKIKRLPFNPPIYRKLGIATRKDLLNSPVVELFIDYCRRHI
jgi:DNA-binding transcriptional LysR family regulator